MKTIETIVTVTNSLQITIQLPSDITSGKHRVVLVIDETPLPPDNNTAKPSLKLNVGEWQNWAPECTFRREDIYNDDRV